MGWELVLRGPTSLYLSRRVMEHDVAVTKQQIRDSMLHERRESIRIPSVQAFVRDVEQTRMRQGQVRSIFSLFGDSSNLHEIAQISSALPRSERSHFLCQRLRPYLQLVEGDLRDVHTGLRLMDIWRYFRLTWSTPYRPNPGRNLFYLIRDAAQECHPIIGIAALGNAMIGLRCRDDRIGWTPDAIAGQLRATKDNTTLFRSTTRHLASLLEGYLETGISTISIDGLTTQNEVTYPSEDGIMALEAIAAEATQERYEHLRQENQFDEEDELTLEVPGATPQVARERRDSYQSLFRRKRAQKLATLLRAKYICQQKDVFTNPPVGLPKLLWSDSTWTSRSEAGRFALRNILLAQKDTKIGTSMMEVTVCGAVPPYNFLLGGKLVAMLLTSPQVVAEYRARYNNRASDIASQMAGQDVTRAADLVYLGTSSLYAGRLDSERFADTESGSKIPSRFASASQYNRVRVPAAILRGTGEVNYECIGITSGFGVVHFATDTREALEDLDIITMGTKRVNSVFGEGTSPRMRKIRQGISHLGLDDRFLIHGQARLVYGINLAHNTERYLLGVDNEPDYIFPQEAPIAATESIAVYWVERWLSSRVEHEETRTKLAEFRAENFAVSLEYGDATAPQQNLTLQL